MGLKPDHWIREMAQKHSMIEPFVDHQVRDGLISFGLSSYGYDIRVAQEFKIFTPGLGDLTVVDPKGFDTRAMVDFRGDVCIIPPNSFALARSVEYFRVPRNVLCVCLGKCLTGDTRVVDAESGAYLPLSEAAHLHSTVGLDNWQLKNMLVRDFIPNGTKPVYELTTGCGLKIRATATHPFRQLDGWKALADLFPGDRIAVARTIPVFGKTPLPDWEAILLGLMISEGQCHTPGHSPTFTTDDPVLARLVTECVREGLRCDVTYKGNRGYRLVNQAGRGGKMTTNRVSKWLSRYRLNVRSGEKFVPQAIFMAPRHTVALFLRALFSGDGSIYSSGESLFVEYCSKSRRLIEDVRHLLLRFGIFSLIREKCTQVGTMGYRVQITDRGQIHRFVDEIGFWPASQKQIRVEQEIGPLLEERSTPLRSNFDTLPVDAWNLVQRAVTTAGSSARQVGIPRTMSHQSLPTAVLQATADATGDMSLQDLTDGPVWDTVKTIEYVGEEPVYDLSVPRVHNFVANDLIAHNSTYARCGIIVNITPFEPEWEGFVTLEISNTTPLPAKIYAGEGISQVLFFEADDECTLSYAERKGKYQRQESIVLPRL